MLARVRVRVILPSRVRVRVILLARVRLRVRGILSVCSMPIDIVVFFYSTCFLDQQPLFVSTAANKKTRL